MDRRAFASFAASVFVAMAIAATAGDAIARSACAVWAHVTDKDPKGANVRASPSSRARVLARLIPGARGTDGPARVVRVVAQSGAWFRISTAKRGDVRQFSGAGWIHGSLLGVQVRGNTSMYAGPSTRAAPVQNTGDVEAEGRLLACRGGWVRIRHNGTGKSGWLSPNDHCAGWTTTCS